MSVMREAATSGFSFILRGETLNLTITSWSVYPRAAGVLCPPHKLHFTMNDDGE